MKAMRLKLPAKYLLMACVPVIFLGACKGAQPREDQGQLHQTGTTAALSPITLEQVKVADGKREFQVVKVDLKSSKVQLQMIQSFEPKRPWLNVSDLAKSGSLVAAVNASFFGIGKAGTMQPMGPTVQEGRSLSSYLDPDIKADKYGVFYCFKSNDCDITTLEDFSTRFSENGKPPVLAVSGMSWSLKRGEIHPQGQGITTGRTVIGLSQDRSLLYLIRGFGSYLDIADAAKQVGAYQAFNFDGGGSSQLLYRTQIFPEFSGQSPEFAEVGIKSAENFDSKLRRVPVILGVKYLL